MKRVACQTDKLRAIDLIYMFRRTRVVYKAIVYKLKGLVNNLELLFTA